MNRRKILFSTLPAAAAASSCFAFETSKGREILDGLLKAINSGKLNELRDFLTKNVPSVASRAANLHRTAEMTGGFALIRVEKDEPGAIEAIVKENLGDNYAKLRFEVENGVANKLGLMVVPRPEGVAGPQRLSQQEAIRVLSERAESEAKADRFAGAVLVERGGKTLFHQAYGLADRDGNVRNDLQTRFRIGSMNKMFTATAALQLVSKGKLDLAGTIGKYLKDYPNQDVASKVTVRHLLTHTGGTGDIFGPDFAKNRLNLRTTADYVKLYGARGLDFTPGSEWRYSNYGFLLLGALIEGVTGMTYYEYVRKNVFEPAGMKYTDSEPETTAVEKRSKGYMRRDSAWVPNTDTLPWRGTSAGGGYSTVEDLAKFAAALQSGKILDKQLVVEMSKTQEKTGPAMGGGGYGYGMGIRAPKDGPTSFGHGGGAPGMNGELRIYPDSGTVVAVLANLDPPAAGRLADFYENRMPLA
jgi:D-alanyl-D-alanine carboxypeptidase